MVLLVVACATTLPVFSCPGGTRTVTRGAESWCEDPAGVRQGPWERSQAGEGVERRTYKDGAVEGPAWALFSNGKIKWKGELRGETRVGDWYAGFDGGNPRAEGRFEDDRPVGPWRTFFPSGALELEGLPAGRVRAAPVFSPNTPPAGWWVRWSEAGTLRAAGAFDETGPVGLHLEWYKDGPLHMAGVYVGGQREGEWVSWWLTGAVRAIDRYERGRSVARFGTWDERGQPSAVDDGGR